MIGGNRNSMLQWGPDCCAATFDPLPVNVGWGNRAAILGDHIYSCGGSISQKCFKASLNGGRWIEIEEMREKRYGHTLTAVGDRLVATGGIRTDGRVAETVEIYTTGGGWQTAGWSLVRMDFRHCAVAVSRSEVLIISGDRTSAMVITKYNVNNGETERLTPPRGATGSAHYCTKYYDHVYVTDYVHGKQHYVWKMALASNQWERLPNLTVDTSYAAEHQIAVVNGELTVFYRNLVQVLRNGQWQFVEPNLEGQFQDGAVVGLP